MTPKPLEAVSDEEKLPWALLTRQARKAELFAAESQPREAWFDLRDESGMDEAVRLLRRVTSILLKPEAMKRGLFEKVLEFARGHGYHPLSVRPVLLSPNTAHAIWRYQWNMATVDRIRLHLFVAEQTPSLLVMLEGTASKLPASVGLWGLKGSSRAVQRDSAHLRTVIGMTNRMIGFVHCPDEPADVLRELGILFSREERVALFRELRERLGRDNLAEVLAAARPLRAACEPHSVDPVEVRRRLVGTPRHERIEELFRAGRRVRLADLERAFGARADPQANWDFIVLAAELIEHDLPGGRPFLDAQAYGEVATAWASAEAG
jgi:nucleoside diphosphate kinase